MTRWSALFARLSLGWLLAALSAAQGADQVATTLGQARWTSREIAVGATFTQARFDQLLGGRQQVSVLRVLRQEPSLHLSIAAPDQGLARTSALATGTSVAAVNGGFFSKDGTAEGLLRIAGKPGRYNERRGSVMLGVSDATVTICDTPSDGGVAFTHALAAGPWLVRDGQPAPNPGGPRHPRTAVGSNAEAVLFVTVDGRAEEAAGMTMHELALLMGALGCDTAFNLDGGGSTTMWVRSLGGVVNCPCDDKRFDAAGERAVANAVLLHGRAVWTHDEEAATLAPAQAWQMGHDRAAIDGDYAEAAAGGSATFTLVVPGPGEYQLEVMAHKGTRLEWSIDERVGVITVKRDGFCILDEVSAAAAGGEPAAARQVQLRLTSTQRLRIDAVRLVEAAR